MRVVAPLAVVALLVAWTVWGARSWPRTKQALDAGDRTPLLREYRITVLGQPVLAASALLACVVAGLDPLDTSPLGLPVTSSSLLVPILVGLGLGGVGGVVGFVVARRRTRRPPGPSAGSDGSSPGRTRRDVPTVGDVAALVPRTGQERRWFVALCVVVGVCEELVFRGFVTAWLGDLGAPGWAVVVTGSVMFGLAHVYQGWSGVVGTTLLGVFLVLLWGLSGQLWVVMVLHALLDLRLLLAAPPASTAAATVDP